jgi:hypothetical protein
LKHYACFDEPPEFLGKLPNGTFEVEIDKLYEHFEEIDELRMYTYFESMVNLMSLMCLGRNNLGIRAL